MATRIALAAFLSLSVASAADPLALWYRQPAAAWTEALPTGNGRLAGMVFGGIEHERIQFNEHTVWTGEPHDYAHPGAAKYLAEIRQLLFDGKQKEAEKLAGEQFMSVPLGQKTYQAFGDIRLEFAHAGATAYRRALDLDTGVATVEYDAGGVHYLREVFASFPDQVLVVRLSANQPGAHTFSAALESAHAGSRVTASPQGEISMTGQVADSAIRFEARLAVQAQGGTVQPRDGKLQVTGASSVLLILSGATNFKSWQDVSGDPAAHNTALLALVRGRGFAALRARHVADHQRLFRRVALDLGTSPAAALPTDERIRGFARGERSATGDAALSIRALPDDRVAAVPGGQPANLQGIWNDSNKPAVGQQVHRQHQHRDELLAGRSRRTWRSATCRCSTR